MGAGPVQPADAKRSQQGKEGVYEGSFHLQKMAAGLAGPAGHDLPVFRLVFAGSAADRGLAAVGAAFLSVPALLPLPGAV